MPDPTSVKELDLSPIPGKKYFTIDREWREEFLYFLIVDRFQDDIVRPISGGAGRAAGINTPNTFFGGNIKGITRNLDYIAGLGCTAIWLSPVFENNPDAYHGYDINNYLRIDPHFGSKQDLGCLARGGGSWFRNSSLRICNPHQLNLKRNADVKATGANHGGCAMLAEIFMIRLEAVARAAKEAANSPRFIPVTLPAAKAS